MALRPPPAAMPFRTHARARPSGIGLAGALLACGLASGMLPCAAHAAALSGRVTLVEHGDPAADVTSAVAWFEPEGGAKRSLPPVTVEIETRGRRFQPRVLAVPVGSTVRFPNADPVRHNVFSVSPGNKFDLGLYGRGPGKSQTFTHAGVVRLFCNVHRQMAAYVLVLDTPWFTTAGPDGRFSLEGLPAGPGILHVWHPRAPEWRLALASPGAETVTASLDTTLPAVPDHLNKFGQPYGRKPDASDY